MAKLIYAAIASLDGFVEDEEGRFEWAAPDGEVHAFVNDLERSIGTYLYGRRMYETMVFWETTPHRPDEPPVFWDYADTVGGGTGIACRAFDSRGAASPGQLAPVTTETTDVVTAAALPSGNYALTWQTFTTNEVIHSIIVKPDCTALEPSSTVASRHVAPASVE